MAVGSVVPAAATKRYFRLARSGTINEPPLHVGRSRPKLRTVRWRGGEGEGGGGGAPRLAPTWVPLRAALFPFHIFVLGWCFSSVLRRFSALLVFFSLWGHAWLKFLFVAPEPSGG